MQAINRLMTNICSSDVNKSKEYYTLLFDFTINFESDWFVHLTANQGSLELGLIDASSEFVPNKIESSSGGYYLTIVVSDTDSVHQLAIQNNATILQEPHDTSYGQRRLLLQAPDGVIIDVSAPIPNFQF